MGPDVNPEHGHQTRGSTTFPYDLVVNGIREAHPAFIVLGILSDGTYALLAGVLAGRLRRTPTARRRLDLSSGLVYLALGAVAATVSQA
jgi:hypothetical protein